MMEYEQPLGDDEQPGLPASARPRPSELAQADELWELLVRLCPPAHRNLLQLRRQGFALAEIAAQTGLHESSVRRILYDLARRLAAVRGGISTASLS
jgi:RNA polymerase sigma-70 factor (ECF subfamily)